MRTRAQAAEPVGLDLAYLSSAYGISEPGIQTLLDAPTAELVRDFLANVTAKAQEYDTLQANKLKVDVELENVVRSSEAKAKAHRAATSKHAQELEDLRRRLNEAENSRDSLNSELAQLRSATSGSTAEVEALRQRIETLEASSRDALALVDRKSSEKDNIASELAQQHEKLLALRREISQLEERNQSLENAASSQKFREQNLQQEIELLKRNYDWQSNELNTRTQEHAKFRKERNARITTLQRELDDSIASVEALQRSEASLKSRLNEIQSKADDAFTKIAGLEEEMLRKEQGWKAELDGSRRLAELQAQNAATHKARLQEVQSQIDQIKDDAADEIGRLQAEIETERMYKNDAESKLAELELKVEQLEQQQQQQRPATPMRNGLSNPGTPARATLSNNAPGSARKYANGLPFSTTQAQAKWYEMQEELVAERRRTAKLSQAMDEMIQEIENRGPELVELKTEQERLEMEVLNFSQMLDEANGARDDALKETQRIQAEVHAKDNEVEILRQQLRDLSTQVKILLVEIRSREEGLGEMSAEERIELERAARGELEDWSSNETFTNQFIAQRLVIFRNVEELQQQNAEQLRLLHTLGEKLEGEEARGKALQSAEYASENAVLKEQLSRYAEELKATNSTIESYSKERDMFRRMLQHRGHIAPDADLQATFGQSLAPTTPLRNSVQMIAQTPRSREVEELNALLKQHQTFFDQFRTEAAVDRKSLQEQVNAISRDKAELQSELAHWKSQKTLADERQTMLQSNYTALRNENTELQKRNQFMAENAAKQDLRTQQVAEDLVEARSMIETLRNENANAKAEKELWKRIETRLQEDNKGLTEERSRLNKLLADLQNLQNERELADSENRRRLQGRTEQLELELTEVKKKLEQEMDDSRKAALRREYEEGQNRTRIDDLVKSLGNVREELVAARAVKDQLQARVDEMKIELRSAEERADALQPRPTPRRQSAQIDEQQETTGEDMPEEQRLALEVSELRRDLDLAKNDLESARQQIEQYKAIAQSTEEELANFNETSERFKEEHDQHMAEKDAHVKELSQKVEDLTSELTTTNSELSELRAKSDDSARVLNEQKAYYESQLARLADDAEKHAEEKKLYQEDLKAQAEIAQQAQQSYENELVKHADAARSLQLVRKEFNDLRSEVANIRAEADAAKIKLEKGEESWSERQSWFEHELEDVTKRRQDLVDQNTLLHRQLESFSTELEALRTGRNITANQQPDEHSVPVSSDSNLQEVIKYLRREKEIVDVQYELSVQEAKRLQQQLDYANTRLEETQQKLADERRAASEKSAAEGSTTKLMQTINELNLYRESAITLRNEARQNRERLEAKSNEVERLLAEIEPLKIRVGELEGELEGKEDELKLLQSDRDHWRERTQNIISKYDRVDPTELEEMKAKLEQLGAEKETLVAERISLKAEVENAEQKREGAVEEINKTMTERLERFRNQAKEQNRRQVTRIKELDAAVSTANSEKAQVEQSLEQTKAELQKTQDALQQAQAQSTNHAEEGEVVESSRGDDHVELNERLVLAEANASQLAARSETLNNEVTRLQTRVVELETQVSDLQQQLGNARQAEEGQLQPDPSVTSAAFTALQNELAAAQQQVETLRADAARSSSSIQNNVAVQADDSELPGNQPVSHDVESLRAELEAQHAIAIKAISEKADERIKAMQNQLRDKLKSHLEKDSQAREQLVAEHSAELERLRGEHQKELAQLKEAHQAEISELTKTNEGVPVKTETEQSAAQAEITGVKMVEMIKTDARVRSLFNNNLKSRVTMETERLQKVISEKDEKIAELNTAIGSAKPAGDSSAEDSETVAELRRRLEVAETEKQAAVRQAVEVVEKKVKVQLNQRDIAQAKLGVVRKAAQETPDKTIKEVWEVADKARPMPKPVNLPAMASPAVSKPATPSLPVTGQTQASLPTQTQLSQTATAEMDEARKKQQRQERFNAGATPATFAQPSTVPAVTTGTFGQPSQVANSVSEVTQQAAGPPPIQQPGANPQAPVFTPANQPSNNNTGSASVRGGSGIPRGGRGSGLPRAGSRGGAQINAAADTAQQTTNAGVAPRGGATTGGIPRGSANAGRGGRGGGPQRGPGAAGSNAGQKRQHEGGQQGDEKRQRGGAPDSAE